jgi:hypothetical protein
MWELLCAFHCFSEVIPKTHPSRPRQLLIVLLVTLLLTAGIAAEQHWCERPDHRSACALCALSFSPAEAIAVVVLLVIFRSSITAPAPAFLTVVAALPAPFDCRAPPAA